MTSDVTQKQQKSQGVLLQKMGGDVRHASWNPCPISELIKNLIPYFRPEALEPGRDKLLRQVHGSWRKH